MIKVDRSEKHSEFEAFRQKKRVNNWIDFSCPRSQYHILYKDCRRQLLYKQGGLSAYTEVPLEENKSHIDHFRKRDLFPNLSFEWNNLIVDEIGVARYGAGHKDKIIKHIEDYELLINPVLEDPCEYLTYLVNGKIIPKKNLNTEDKKKASFTIEAFNLNHPSLIMRRSTLQKIVEDYSSLDDQFIKSNLKKYGFITFLAFILENKVDRC